MKTAEEKLKVEFNFKEKANFILFAFHLFTTYFDAEYFRLFFD
jgi:hypothetical protein